MGAEIQYACNCNSDAREEPAGAPNKEYINVLIIIISKE